MTTGVRPEAINEILSSDKVQASCRCSAYSALVLCESKDRRRARRGGRC